MFSFSFSLPLQLFLILSSAAALSLKEKTAIREELGFHIVSNQKPTNPPPPCAWANTHTLHTQQVFMCPCVQARSSLLTYMVFSIEVSCPSRTRQAKNRQSWRMDRVYPQRDNCSMTHPSVSDWGRRPQLWVWKCCSQVFVWAFVFLFKHEFSSSVGWLSTATSKHFWVWKRKSSDICIFFSIHRPSADPHRGGNGPLTLRSRGKVLHLFFISMDLTDRLRKERWEGG